MKSIKLTMPCKEDWINMIESEKGKFCSACSKNIIDFSKLSAEEIIKTLKFAKGNVCARVTHTQINTPLLEFEKRYNKSSPFSKFAASFILATSLITTQACESKDSRPSIHIEQKQNITTVTNSSSKNQSISSVDSPTTNTSFNGNIISQKTNKPLQNAQITFVTLLNSFIAFTDINGEFSIEIPSSSIKDINVVRISFQNIFDEYDDQNDGEFIRLDNSYKTEDLLLSKKEINDRFHFEAQTETFYLGGIGLHDYQKRNKPIVVINGEQVNFEEFQKAKLGKSSSCNLANKDYFYFEAEPAIALYGTEAKDGLYLLMNTN